MFKIDDDSLEAQEIFSNTDQGDEAVETENFDGAVFFYKKAWDAIPEPKNEWELAHWVMSCIGGSYYDGGDYDHAIEYLSLALTCYRGDIDSEIHFSLGRSYFDKGDMKNAQGYLQKSWDLSEGRSFKDEDPKYLCFLKKT